jgi:hypothetical protein
VPAELFERILQDAASRPGVDAAQIRVVSSESVTWRDGSLGCPEPGRMYTQALVPGFRVVLSAGDETLRYHAGRGDAFIFCPEDRATEPLDGTDGES